MKPGDTPRAHEPPANERLLTVPEMAGRLRISRSTLMRLHANGQLPHLRVGRRILFTEAHLGEIMRGFEVRPELPEHRRRLTRRRAS